MANTFKLKTKAGVTTLATVYTVPSSTTAIVLGLMIGNTTSSSITSTVTLSSNTSDTETNADVELITASPIPGNSSLEIMSGNKIVLQETDYLRVYGSGAVDVTLSIMEIT
jgi:hypothetical protein